MDPEKRPFRPPLTPLGTLFVTVVLAGSVLFHVFRLPVASLPRLPGKTVDGFSSKKKHLELRALDRCADAPASAPSAGEEERDAGIPCPAPGTLTTPEEDRTLRQGMAAGSRNYLAGFGVQSSARLPLVLRKAYSLHRYFAIEDSETPRAHCLKREACDDR